MSSHSHQFETKRGECRIEDNTLVLDESFVIYFQRFYDRFWNTGSWRHKAIFVGFLFTPIVYLGWFVNLIVSPGRDAILWVAVIIVGLLAVVAYQRVVRGFTRTMHIPLDAITSVTAERGTKGLTHPRFVVTYRKNETQRRRYIMMPSRITPNGDAAFEQARAIVRDAGLEINGKSTTTT